MTSVATPVDIDQSSNRYSRHVVHPTGLWISRAESFLLVPETHVYCYGIYNIFSFSFGNPDAVVILHILQAVFDNNRMAF